MRDDIGEVPYRTAVVKYGVEQYAAKVRDRLAAVQDRLGVCVRVFMWHPD